MGCTSSINQEEDTDKTINELIVAVKQGKWYKVERNTNKAIEALDKDIDALIQEFHINVNNLAELIDKKNDASYG